MNYSKDGKNLNDLLKLTIECLMRSERKIHNEKNEDSNNGFRPRKLIHGGKILELQVPGTRFQAFKPIILGILKAQQAEIEKLAYHLYTNSPLQNSFMRTRRLSEAKYFFRKRNREPREQRL